MKFYDFTHKINWRLITTHFIATFFMILASRQFALLNDIVIIKTADQYGDNNLLKHLVKEENFEIRITNFLLWTGLSSLIGILLAFIISLTLTIKKQMFWLNALIVFITAILLDRLGLFDNKIIDTVFFAFGNLVTQFGLQYKFITNGVVLALFAVFIFFSKWTNNFALSYLENIPGSLPTGK